MTTNVNFLHIIPMRLTLVSSHLFIFFFFHVSHTFASLPILFHPLSPCFTFTFPSTSSFFLYFVLPSFVRHISSSGLQLHFLPHPLGHVLSPLHFPDPSFNVSCLFHFPCSSLQVLAQRLFSRPKSTFTGIYVFIFFPPHPGSFLFSPFHFSLPTNPLLSVSPVYSVIFLSFFLQILLSF